MGRPPSVKVSFGVSERVWGDVVARARACHLSPEEWLAQAIECVARYGVASLETAIELEKWEHAPRSAEHALMGRR